MKGEFIAEFPIRCNCEGYRIKIIYRGEGKFNGRKTNEEISFRMGGFIANRSLDDYIREKIEIADKGLFKIKGNGEFKNLDEFLDTAYIVGYKMLKN